MRGGRRTARASPSATSPTARRRQRSALACTRGGGARRGPELRPVVRAVPGRGAVVRVDVLFVVPFTRRRPSSPSRRASPRAGDGERVARRQRDARRPSRRRRLLEAGKGADELDPERAHGRGPPRAQHRRAVRRRVRAVPRRRRELRRPQARERPLSGVDDGPCVKSADECPDPVNDDTKASGGRRAFCVRRCATRRTGGRCFRRWARRSWTAP